MKDTSPENPSRLRWHALQTRVTAFHPDGWKELHLSDWWEKVFHQPPDRTESKPREHSELVSGRIGLSQLVANASPGRTDFILEPPNYPPTEAGSIWPEAPVTYQEALANSLELMGSWLSTDMQVNRLAVGAILILPCPGLNEVYATLSNALLAVDFKGSLSTIDFQYRINRVRPAVQSIATAINRLATWSVAERQRVVMAPGNVEPQTHVVQDYAVRLELDINTRPEVGIVFPSEARPDILSELKEMAVEIAEQGDKP